MLASKTLGSRNPVVQGKICLGALDEDLQSLLLKPPRDPISYTMHKPQDMMISSSPLNLVRLTFSGDIRLKVCQVLVVLVQVVQGLSHIPS